MIRLRPKKLYYTHFGVRGDAVKRLEAYVSQLKLWANIIHEGMKNYEDPEVIYERVLEKDALTRKAADFIKNHLVLRRAVVMQNIHGLIEYFEKTSQADISQESHK
ncbi:MAG: hypothetical protein ACETV1_02085 [Candidatus Bathyarchaeia archaeon]